jgi:hypothetical protein
MKNFENYFKKEKWMNPVRNSCGASNPAGITLGPNPAAEQRGIISNGVKVLLLFGIVLLIFFPSYAGSIKEVSQNIKQVQSIEPPLQFAIIGDSRDGEKIYTKLVQRILDRKPAFMIHLGDMISQPGEKEWQTFFEISKPISIPFFPVVGNHDVGSTRKGEEIYLRQFLLPDGKTYYAFRAGGVLFIILDSEKGGVG